MDKILDKIKTIDLIPSDYDERDYHAKDFLVSGNLDIKSKMNQANYITPELVPIYNQGHTGMCGGFTLSSIMSMFNYKETGIYERYSPGFIYGVRENDDYQGEGLVLKEVLKMAVQYGTCSFNDFDKLGTYYEVKVALDKKLTFLKPKAKENGFKSYYRIGTRDIDAIKQSIVENGAVVIGWKLFSSLGNVTSDGIVKETDSSHSKFLGGHCSYYVGWKTIDNKLHWIIANSWGDKVADKGFYYVPHDYKQVMEVFGVTDKKFRANNKEVSFRENDTKLYVQEGENWYTIDMDVPPMIVDGRFLMPARAICEALGLNVTWDNNTRMATVGNYVNNTYED